MISVIAQQLVHRILVPASGSFNMNRLVRSYLQKTFSQIQMTTYTRYVSSDWIFNDYNNIVLRKCVLVMNASNDKLEARRIPSAQRPIGVAAKRASMKYLSLEGIAAKQRIKLTFLMVLVHKVAIFYEDTARTSLLLWQKFYFALMSRRKHRKADWLNVCRADLFKASTLGRG